jgi:hypothetical protein
MQAHVLELGGAAFLFQAAQDARTEDEKCVLEK